MTTLQPPPARQPARFRSPLQRRLRPLHLAVALQGFMLWVPIEKLFMSEIGFDAAAVGVMAAAYAAVVPIVEVPSGILADRWSRRGVLIVASTALALCALIGGLSTDVPTYILSALILGVFFAMHSGTLDSVVYDTVLEETGHSDAFEQRIGRVRLTESIALVSGCTVRRLDRQPHFHPADLFPDNPVRCAVRPGLPAFPRAAAARGRGAHLVAAPPRPHLPGPDPARAAAADHHPHRADLTHPAADPRVRAAVAGGTRRTGRPVRAVLGRPDVHLRPRWAARRAAPAPQARHRRRRRRAHDPGQRRTDRDHQPRRRDHRAGHRSPC